jgi:hypothetical protein
VSALARDCYLELPCATRHHAQEPAAEWALGVPAFLGAVRARYARRPL